ncbi:dihydrofolate reductase-like [Ambystoma mexicanum]|uniref:dihydrofolate reductase-like n=1 Tax=Ambystoma mexicanum TaxID=8296 RepID=UPI0037E8E3E4
MSKTGESVDPKPIHLIVAACRNRGIGQNGDMPWSLPNEFKYCLNTITSVKTPGKKNLIIWGRKTSAQFTGDYMPLRNCLTVLLTTTMRSLPKHAHYICSDLESAIQLAYTQNLSEEIETIWVLGGVKSFTEAMKHPLCRRIHFTDIMADFNCDVFFPEFDENIFKLVEEFPGIPSGIQEENGIKYEFRVFAKHSICTKNIN